MLWVNGNRNLVSELLLSPIHLQEHYFIQGNFELVLTIAGVLLNQRKGLSPNYASHIK